MKYYKRGFLNKDEGMAAFCADVSVDTEATCYSYINADFTISDCNRQITLDFCIGDISDVAKMSDKLVGLINELQEFREQLNIAVKEFIIIETKLNKEKLSNDKSE